VCNDLGNHIPYDDYLAAFSQTRIPVRWPTSAPDLEPHEDIWPTDRAPVIRRMEDGSNEFTESVGLRACLKSPGRQSSTARDRFRKPKRAVQPWRQQPLICPSTDLRYGSQIGWGGWTTVVREVVSRRLSAEPAIHNVGSSWRVRRETACTERSYWGHTRLLGVYELAFPGSVLIAVISLPLGETNISKVGRPTPSGSSV
jgi:hypothetical protein